MSPATASFRFLPIGFCIGSINRKCSCRPFSMGAAISGNYSPNVCCEPDRRLLRETRVLRLRWNDPVYNTPAMSKLISQRLTRRQALEVLGLTVVAGSLPKGLFEQAPAFPKGAIIRTVLKVLHCRIAHVCGLARFH